MAVFGHRACEEGIRVGSSHQARALVFMTDTPGWLSTGPRAVQTCPGGPLKARTGSAPGHSREREMVSYCLMGTRFPFGENVLEPDSGDGCTAFRAYLIPLNCML